MVNARMNLNEFKEQNMVTCEKKCIEEMDFFKLSNTQGNEFWEEREKTLNGDKHEVGRTQLKH